MIDLPDPAVCVTVSAATTAELRRRRDQVADADLIELRLDGLADPDPVGAVAGRRRPVIVTCRPAWEGGAFEGAERERLALLERARQAGAEFIDVEWKAEGHASLLGPDGRGVVLSLHDFEGAPADLEDQVAAMRATGAEVVKIAIQARRLTDNLRLLAMRSQTASQVVIAMGPAGLPSRVLAARFGSRWTYAGDRAEVGQLQVDRLLDEFRFRSIGRGTDVFGVVGRPIAHSVSPAMHNAAFDDAAIDAVYLPLEAADVADFEDVARRLDVRGASVTAPYKTMMRDRVDRVDSLTERVGALNTLRRTDGGWEGRNTDVDGFLAPLGGRSDLAGSRVAVLGSGGAARAAACGMADRGARVTVYGRDVHRARAVAVLVGGRASGMPPQAGTWDMLVNATPVGTHPDVDATPVPGLRLDGRVVYDLVYNPEWTRLLRDARAAGCETISGLDMLVAQAALQFEWWTARRPSTRRMRDAAERRLAAVAASARSDETSPTP